MQKIKILIADDSAFMRRAIRSMLETDSDIEVLGTARNGREAVEKVRELKPDIMTMDIEMPEMNGLQALQTIMQTNPLPVLMVSSLTTEGAQATIEAMSLGAVDFVPKQTHLTGTQRERMQSDLLNKVKSIVRSNRLKSRLTRTRDLLSSISRPAAGSTAAPMRPDAAPADEKTDDKRPLTLKERIERRRNRLKGTPQIAPAPEDAVAPAAQKIAQTAYPTTGRLRPKPAQFRLAVLGVSTGGPLALHSLIPCLPGNLPVALLIVQHMPAHFTKSLADRLDLLSHLNVKEAEDNDSIRPGQVLIAPGGLHMTVSEDKKSVRISTSPADTLHKPSVDVMINSAVDAYGGRMLGVIMTGMGKDGYEGLSRLSTQGGYVLSQNEDSCVVYGMPKAVVDGGIADEIHPLEDLADAVASCFGLKAVAPKKAMPHLRAQ